MADKEEVKVFKTTLTLGFTEDELRAVLYKKKSQTAKNLHKYMRDLLTGLAKKALNGEFKDELY